MANKGILDTPLCVTTRSTTIVPLPKKDTVTCLNDYWHLNLFSFNSNLGLLYTASYILFFYIYIFNFIFVVYLSY